MVASLTIVSVLLAISESLSLNKSVKSNGIIQAIMNITVPILKAIKDLLIKK
jgi:uncharacterized protein YggT (Ycf19 family)